MQKYNEVLDCCVDLEQKFIHEDSDMLIDTIRAIKTTGVFQMIYGFISDFYMNIPTGNKLIMYGNGGSAADCDHIVGEFRNRFIYDRLPINAMSLSCSSATITAISNDFTYDEVFSRQLNGIVNRNDSIIALSTSGTSKNIVRSLCDVRNKFTILNSLLISGPCDMNPNFKYHIRIPIDVNCICKTARIQEVTMYLLHTMCYMFDSFFEKRECNDNKLK